jgi:hypothetical protein
VVPRSGTVDGRLDVRDHEEIGSEDVVRRNRVAVEEGDGDREGLGRVGADGEGASGSAAATDSDVTSGASIEIGAGATATPAGKQITVRPCFMECQEKGLFG